MPAIPNILQILQLLLLLVSLLLYSPPSISAQVGQLTTTTNKPGQLIITNPNKLSSNTRIPRYSRYRSPAQRIYAVHSPHIDHDRHSPAASSASTSSSQEPRNIKVGKSLWREWLMRPWRPVLEESGIDSSPSVGTGTFISNSKKKSMKSLDTKPKGKLEGVTNSISSPVSSVDLMNAYYEFAADEDLHLMDVAGYLTEVISFNDTHYTSPASSLDLPPPFSSSSSSSSPTTPKSVLLFFPGNPGIINFYFDFLRNLHSILTTTHSLDIDVYGVGYPGHSSRTCNGSIVSLSKQIDHKIAFYNMIKSQYPPNTQFYVMGHSTGALIALTMMDSFPNEFVKGVFITPAIHEIQKSPKGKEYMQLTKDPSRFAHSITTLLRTLPPTLGEYLLSKVFVKYDGAIELVKSKLLHPKQIENCIQLFKQTAHHTTYLKDTLDQARENLKHKLRFYYIPGDYWIPEGAVEEIKSFHGEFVKECGNDVVPHNFVFGYGREIAEEVAEFLID